MDATYLFAGGGSGGHLFPGIAVAEELRRRNPETRIVFAGSERPVERAILEPTGYVHHALPVESLRELKRSPPRFLWRNWSALKTARQILRAERPRMVIGLGGFASAPAVWAASRMGIPVVLIEQNVVPGAATRWLARCANQILISFEETREKLPGSVATAITGNPVRSEIVAAAIQRNTAAAVSSEQTLLILGGSQGAETLNEAVMTMWESGRMDLTGWRVVHQAGVGRVAALRERYQALGIDTVVEEFFPRVSEWYVQADLVISRAGATTLAELMCVGCPAVLVPYPFAADQHQRVNAEALCRRHAAAMALQAENSAATSERLSAAVADLLNDPERRAMMSQAALAAAHPDAAARVVDIILETARRSAA